MNYIGLNGVPVRSSEAVVSVMDHGFMYGIGLFETFRTYEGRPSLLELHLERLREGCLQLGISYQPDIAILRSEIAGLLALNGLRDGYFRLTVSAGEGPLGLTAEDYDQPAVILYVKPLPPVAPTLYIEGKQLWLLETRRNTPETKVRLKSLHFMNNVRARRELSEYERLPENGSFRLPSEGVMLTEDGVLSEGITSNLFFIHEGVLYTPEIETGILPGITRAVVLELAAGLGLTVKEGRYRWESLLRADEVFVTNSIQELIPVTRLIRRHSEEGEQEAAYPACVQVGSGKIGPFTRELLDLYRKKVGANADSDL
ncbi:4-amino-4-deoxychorismate lyase [Paenibacillus antibioticophila]|uniref:4-amino-4-deoxychorismate lyase n=1 Tax=Paenibacillus antibioticophila TaxID=1274374 RepID=A0A919Y0G7_9BACL|nr:aminotransferase class IV [Paenibacillus antibioticophila]GIO39755.1 4-amino-4-deoxychorismate lyase [Paenibacillus antibioticophila]